MTDVREGSSSILAFALFQADGVTPIAKADLLTLTLKLYVADGGAIINSASARDVLDVNGGAVSSTCVGTIDLAALDNPVVGTGLSVDEAEIHAALLKFTASGGVAGSGELRFNVTKIG